MTTANAPAQLGNESYRFDALDNLRGANIGSSTFVHTVDSQNRLSQIQKDGALHVSYSQNAQGDTTLRNFAGVGSENIFANGFENVVLRTPEFAANQVLNYDRAHRLTSITGVESYQYDAHGRRVITARASDGLKRYQLYSNAGVLMHTEDQRTSEVIDYVNLEGQLVAERTTPLFGGLVTTRYQHADLRGSPTVVSNAGGTQVERSIEQPFGAPYDGIYRDGPGFTGHATDAASGLSYMQQRYYDPIAMRFLSVDPEQSEFSRYSYGANNPFKFVDPDGRKSTVQNNRILIQPEDKTVPAVTLPNNVGAEGISSSDSSFHTYNVETKSNLTGNQASAGLKNNPTPGDDAPASTSGTANDVGYIPVLPGSNLVNSYLIPSPDTSKISDIVVNYTISGEHKLEEGFVIRFGEVQADGSTTLRSYGEGNNWHQDPFIEDVWEPQVEKVWQQNQQEIIDNSNKK